MNREEYARMHALETNYWWFVGRRRIVARLLQATLPRLGKSAPRLLDIGCGTGANLPMLCAAVGPEGRVTGIDFSPYALQFALRQEVQPNLALSQGDAQRLPFPDQTFDVVTMLDVLEHLPDDGVALAEVFRVLRPGGMIILTVPAYQHLWSAHDEALHHFRRYEKKQLGLVLRQAGLQTWRLSFAMSLMPPLAWAWRKFILPCKPGRPKNAKRHSEGAVLPGVPPWANQLLIQYVDTEGRILLRWPLKFGTSLVAVAYRIGISNRTITDANPDTPTQD